MASFEFDTTGFAANFKTKVKHEIYLGGRELYSNFTVANKIKPSEQISQWNFPGYFGVYWRAGFSLPKTVPIFEDFIDCSDISPEKFTYSYDDDFIFKFNLSQEKIVSRDDFMRSATNTTKHSNYNYIVDTPYYSFAANREKSVKATISLISPEIMGIDIAQDLFRKTAPKKLLQVSSRFFEVVRPAIEQNLKMSK